MDAFEQIVEGLFQERGYWTRVGFKVKLSPAEKVAIINPTTPRPEIDILAYKPGKNELLWIECKSLIDSSGVRMRSFDPSDVGAKKIKIFTDANYRNVVSARLIEQLIADGLVITKPELQFCLVAGHIVAKDRAKLSAHFQANKWLLFDESWIVQELKKVSTNAYENNIAVIVAKLLERTRSNDGY